MEQRYQSIIRSTKLLPSEAQGKQYQDREYLMELTNENLLLPYYLEAGLAGFMWGGAPNSHRGWDDPLCQIRGTFTGHWLSAAARIWNETKDWELKAKADKIVSEIGRCQQANGGRWAFPIPEKYILALRDGRHFWAPQYVCHKVMMGLLDMYLYGENQQALEILKGCADWFVDFMDHTTKEQLNEMMDLEETGGSMELWGDLYSVTHDENHLRLMRFYERTRLTEPVYRGEDVLSNMHANTTIPEIHGCAKAYEITGEERYLQIVKNYWDLAVTKRGQFATGGQTDGEVWTSPGRLAVRRSHLNQEHCVVYNMIRLADYLFRFTGDVKYLDYIELNRENGLFAQGFWKGRNPAAQPDPYKPDTGLIAYYLPLAPGSKKAWGSRKGDFWCCHCTLVQANAKHRDFIFYEAQNSAVIAQYQPAQTQVSWNGTAVQLSLTYTDLVGETIRILDSACQYPRKPAYLEMELKVRADQQVHGVLRFRLPWWRKGQMELYRNGQQLHWEEKDGFACLEGDWQQDDILIRIPRGLSCAALPDEPDTVAFLDGPVVLAGLIGEERTLVGSKDHPEDILKPSHERQWTEWMEEYRTVGQPVNFRLKPLKDIGDETYTVYFPLRPDKN